MGALQQVLLPGSSAGSNGFISPFYPTTLYSLRKRNSAYSGFCLRVQRSSDSTTQDIGFGGDGYVDYTALLAFCSGSNNGFVTIWYDQSGSGVNVSGTAMQIVTAGALTATASGKGMIVGVAANSPNFTVAANAVFAFGTGSWTWEALGEPTTATSGLAQVLIDFRDGGSATALFYNAAGNIPTYFDGANHNNGVGSIVNNVFAHSGCEYDGSNMRVFYAGNIQDTEALSPSFSGNRPLNIGSGFNAALYFSGYFAEIRITKGTSKYGAPSYTPPDFFA